MLSLNNITKYYRNKAALESIPLKFKPATNTVLIEPRGWCKPALLRNLVGIRLDVIGLILQGVVPAASLALIAQAEIDLIEASNVPKELQLSSESVI